MSHHLPDDLWRRFEEPNEDSVEELIKNLEHSVSCGWLGAATEISEYLQHEAVSLLDQKPVFRVRVEIERMKRFSYFGFQQLTRSGSAKVIDYIEKLRNELPTEHALLWEFTALGFIGWCETEPGELKKLIERCRDITKRFVDSSPWKGVCACFLFAMQGRLNALDKEARQCHHYFGRGIELAKSLADPEPATRLDQRRSASFKLVLAHIQIHYAESVALLKDWECAVKLARAFLLNADKNQFRSHLLMRAYLILLEAPDKYVSVTDFEYNARRFNMLVDAMGLAQSQTIYPLLAKAKRIISRKSAITEMDLYQLYMPGDVQNKINELDGYGFERLLRAYYESDNFKVIDLSDSLPAIDLIAINRSLDGVEHVLAIQAKSGKGVIKQDDIPNENAFDEAVGYLAKNHSIFVISAFHWHTLSKLHYKASTLLKRRVEGCIGKNCGLREIRADDLVKDLLPKRDILFRLFFTNEFKTR
jgi:hypothetical protein